MPIYEENENKLNLDVSDSEQLVKITIDSYHGTVASVSFDHGTIKTVNGGETLEIGKASELKGSSLEFTGSANNPDGNDIKIRHTIFEFEDQPLIYTFPDDYTGTNNYDSSDENPTYVFLVNFIWGLPWNFY